MTRTFVLSRDLVSRRVELDRDPDDEELIRAWCFGCRTALDEGFDTLEDAEQAAATHIDHHCNRCADPECGTFPIHNPGPACTFERTNR